MKFKMSALIVVATLSMSASLVAVANPVTNTTNPADMAVDPTTKAFYSLGACTEPEQLDCIQSVHIKGPTGGWVEAIQAFDQEWTTEVESNGNTRYNSGPMWTASPLLMNLSL